MLGKARTLNPQIRSLILYPIELQALFSTFYFSHPLTPVTCCIVKYTNIIIMGCIIYSYVTYVIHYVYIYNGDKRKKGFEPSTFALATQRSTIELLPHSTIISSIYIIFYGYFQPAFNTLCKTCNLYTFGYKVYRCISCKV